METAAQFLFWWQPRGAVPFSPPAPAGGSMRWPDGTDMLWPDGSEMEWPG